jgi:hypothetical protein
MTQPAMATECDTLLNKLESRVEQENLSKSMQRQVKEEIQDLRATTENRDSQQCALVVRKLQKNAQQYTSVADEVVFRQIVAIFL